MFLHFVWPKYIVFLCRPSNPPNFKQLIEEYIDRCTGTLFCRLRTPSTVLLLIKEFYTGTEKMLVKFYIILLADLSRKILRGIALALGGSADEMEGEIGGDPFWVLRIIGYPAASISNGNEKADSDVGWLVVVLVSHSLFFFFSQI